MKLSRLIKVLCAAALVAAPLIVLAATPPPAGAVVTSTQSVDSSAFNSLESVSCPTSSFCAAVDNQGHVALYNGTIWTAYPTVSGGNTLAAVACTSSSFCLALDNQGNAYEYDGSSWSPDPENPITPYSFTSVSCASISFCAAADSDGDVYYYNTGVWLPGGGVAASSITSISCPTSSYCAATDNTENFYQYNGSSWSTSLSPAGGSAISRVSCAITDYCVLATDAGALYDNSFGPYDLEINLTTGVSGLSCATDGFCAAVTSSGSVTVSTSPGTWSALTFLDASGLDAVSCASFNFCATTDYASNVLDYNGASWSEPSADPLVATTPLTVISCPTTTFCAAGDNNGNVFTDTSGSWSGATSLDTAEITSITCPTATFCLAGDANGNVFVDTSGSWTAVTSPDTTTVTGLSCTSAAFCVAATGPGENTFISINGGLSWSLVGGTASPFTGASCASSSLCVTTTTGGAALVDSAGAWDPVSLAGDSLVGVSCAPASTFCGVVDSDGNSYFYNAGTWTSGGQADGSATPTSISCPTNSFCVVTDTSGNTVAYNASLSPSWSADPTNPLNSPAASINAASCASALRCVLVDANGNALNYTPQAVPTLSINNIPSTGIVGGNFTPAVTTNSSGTVSYTDTTSSICAYDAGTGVVTYVAAGLCTLQLSIAATNSYFATNSSDQSFTVTAVPTTPGPTQYPQSQLHVTSTNGVVGTPLTLTTSGGSGAGVITFALDAPGSANCTLSGSTINANTVGSCNVTATKAANGTYVLTSSAPTAVTFSAATTPPTTGPPPVSTKTTKLTKLVGPFANGSSTLSSALARSTAAAAALSERHHETLVTVTGYASSSGTLAENRALSLARAQAVAALLRTNFAHRHYDALVVVVSGGVGTARTPAANRVVSITLS